MMGSDSAGSSAGATNNKKKRSGTAVIIEAIRWSSVLAVIICMLVWGRNGRISRTDVREVRETVITDLDFTGMKEGDDSGLRRLYGLDPAEFDGYMFYMPVSNMDAEELLIIKLRDKAQKTAVEEAFKNRLQTQKNSFEGYGIEQFDLLTNSSVAVVDSGFGIFIVHKNAAAVYAAVKKMI